MAMLSGKAEKSIGLDAGKPRFHADKQLTFSVGACSPSFPQRKVKCRNGSQGRRLVAEKRQSPGNKRSRWQIFGGFATVAGGALAMAKGVTTHRGNHGLDTSINNNIQSSSINNNIQGGYDGGSSGGGNHGSGGNEGGGSGGDGGGNHGNGPGLASRDDDDEERSAMHVPCLQGLASLSSSANEKGLKPSEVARLVDAAQILVETSEEKSAEKKCEENEATIGSETSKVGFQVVLEDRVGTSMDRRDETQSWLAKFIESVLVKSGVRRRRLGDRERQELAEELAAAVVQRLANDGNVAKSYEIGFLKRLQREAFSDIMKSREKLEKLELSVKKIAESSELSKVQLSARAAAGGAFVLMQDISSYISRSALEEAGLPVGIEAEMTIKKPFREKDMLTTRCVSGHAGLETDTLGGPFQLSKLSYEAEIAADTRLTFVPLGAEAKDVVEIVNPVQDQALTKFAKSGPTLFSNCGGSAVGITYESETTMVSVSEFLSGWGDSSGPLCLSTLGQFIHQPSERFVASVTGLNRFWPSPPLPSTPGLHWSEMRPFLMSRSSRSSRDLRNSAELVRGSGEFQPKGTSMQTLAFSGAVDLGRSVSVGGWVQAERGDWIDKKRMQWAVSVGKNNGKLINWGVNVGTSRPDLWRNLGDGNQEGDTTKSKSPLLQVEGFIKCKVGQGFTLQPGMVYLLNQHCQTPALVLKAEWNL